LGESLCAAARATTTPAFHLNRSNAGRTDPVRIAGRGKIVGCGASRSGQSSRYKYHSTKFLHERSTKSLNINFS
jgi:hypothetical protein